MSAKRYLRSGPTPTKAMTVRIPEALHDRLTAAADLAGISVNALVNDAVEATVTRIETDTPKTPAGPAARSAYADVIARLGGTHQ